MNLIQCFSISPKYGIRLISNRATGPGVLSFTVYEDAQIHMHSPDGIPFINEDGNLKDTVLWGTKKELLVSVTEIVNDPNVIDLNIEQRNCRFPKETVGRKGKGFSSLLDFVY